MPVETPAILDLIGRVDPAAPALVVEGAPPLAWGVLRRQVAERAARLRRGEEKVLIRPAGEPLETAIDLFSALQAGIALFPYDPALPAATLAPLKQVARFGGTGPSLLVATSGSEHSPRLVELPVASLMASAHAAVVRFGLEEGDRWLDPLPLCHVGGIAVLLRALRVGATVHLAGRFDPDGLWNTLRREPVTHLSLVPAMLGRLLERAGSGAPPARLRVVLVSGAALSPELAQRALGRGWPLWIAYGASETASAVAARPLQEADGEPERVGPPLPGVRLEIEGRGGEGRIVVSGPMVAGGYLGGRGEEELQGDGRFRSRDLGRLTPEGELVVIGRMDEALIVGGENLHPAQVETVLAGAPGIGEVAVAGLPDPEWGARLIACYTGEASAESLVAWSRERLPGPWRPREWRRLASLPRLASGKPDRRRLRRLLSARG